MNRPTKLADGKVAPIKPENIHFADTVTAPLELALRPRERDRVTPVSRVTAS